MKEKLPHRFALGTSGRFLQQLVVEMGESIKVRPGGSATFFLGIWQKVLGCHIKSSLFAERIRYRIPKYQCVQVAVAPHLKNLDFAK